MEAELYDEFGNYIGPELESDESEEEREAEEDAEPIKEVTILLTYDLLSPSLRMRKLKMRWK